MTASIDAVPDTVGATSGSGASPARWARRAAAFAVDVLPGTGVLATSVVAALTVPLLSRWWYVAVSVGGAAMLLTAMNRVIAPAVSGFSLGRALAGVSVVTRDGSPVGAGRLLLRDLAHLIDTAAFLVGWLWPLWDSRGRTFADLLTRTEVRDARPRSTARVRRDRAAAVALAAALASLVVTAMCNLAVYHHERVDDRTHADLAIQGPKAVAEMLSYHPKTLTDDFAHAQTLATDKYRAELVTVQQQVAKSPAPHEYWVPDSAVLSATGDRATMLMFLQGQTGGSPKIQPITATVKVAFVKTAGRWLIDELTFVPAPQRPEAGR